MTEWTSAAPSELTPVDVEKQLLRLIDTLSIALTDWKRLYRDYKDAEREYDTAYAKARLRAADSGVAANDRKYYADLDTAVAEARQAMDLAEATFKYAEQRLRGVHTAISTWQSVGTHVRQAYATAGRGEF